MPTAALLTRQESAAYLRISERTLDRRIREGRLPFVCAGPGGRIFLRERDLDAYIKHSVRTHRTINKSN